MDDKADHVTVAPPSRRGMGRPVTADPRAIEDAALRLFTTHGYDNVTMDDIAQEANVSRSTLCRLFPSKSATFWGTRREYDSAYRRILAARPADEPLARNVVEAQRAHDRMFDERRPSDRYRIRLVSEGRSAATGDLWSVYEDWCTCVIEHVRSRRPELDALASEAMGRMLFAGVWSAVVHWAQSEDASADAYYDRVLPYLERVAG